MKKYKSLFAIALSGSLLLTTGCKDDFAELNQDPSAVKDGNPAYLFAQGVLEFEPSDYTYWFYNAAEIFQWVQTGVSTGGVSSRITEGASFQGFKSIEVLRYQNELEFVRSKMIPSESEKYQAYSAALNILSIYMGLYDSDFTGNIPFTESAKAMHGGTLTPKYDRVEDLYALWLTTLDNCINTFETAKDQQFTPAQDVVYNGKVESWAKLANSLKLKIAARLIAQNKEKALKIAEEVVNASCGYINGSAEDFLFNKATYNSENNDKAYHWNNAVLQTVGGSQSFINFLVKNKDPRVRFIFEKNHWNSKIVQLFFDAKRKDDIPQYIMDNVDYEVISDTIYKFKGWKGAGEPWVRYYGLPLEFNAGQQASKYGDWFNYDINCKYDANHTYRPWSMFQEEMLRGRKEFRVPTRPSDTVIEDKDQNPWYGMYLTTSEINLYLAEFKLLGANLPQTAQEYFSKAIRASVEEYDRLARLNKIPYYGTNYDYDPNEVSIELKTGEIETLLQSTDYQLTGDKVRDLEKVYLQQIIHFSLLPVEQYTTARRSGVPMLNSTILNRVDYAANQIPTSSIPRRMALSAPSPTDLMFDILQESYKEQGFSIGSGPRLNSERLWQDKGAPQWGEGPKF